MASEGYYDSIEAVKDLDRVDSVNTHLAQGWKLKKTAEVDRIIDLDGRPVLQRYLSYIMVLPKGVQAGTTTTAPPTRAPPVQPPPPAKPSGPPVEVRLQALPFKEFSKDGRTWFSIGPNDIPEDVAKWLQTLKDWKYVDEEGCEYTLSKAGWVNRKKK